ncbi:MAG TPA: DUF6653 family protein [Fimbriimonadaceae bacterium]|nr:DUF6653 family protein [Fimbriimonadaceae bacterium]
MADRCGSRRLPLHRWGLWALDVWPTVYGATLVVFSQLWQLDRMRLLYDELQAKRQDVMPTEIQ